MTKFMKIKSYSEMCSFSTFIERFNYLKLNGKVGIETFGFDRYLNQVLYCSQEWKRFRRQVIIRDNGCIFGLDGYDINGRLIVHHINPITLEQIEQRDPMIFSMENVVCVTHNVHEAIHYGDESLIPTDPIIRKPNDTCLWK
nr:MAG TPA: HNH endonuclease bacteriophage, HNH Endonuclease, DNA.52A [Caudoviricetes sp.]